MPPRTRHGRCGGRHRDRDRLLLIGNLGLSPAYLLACVSLHRLLLSTSSRQRAGTEPQPRHTRCLSTLASVIAAHLYLERVMQARAADMSVLNRRERKEIDAAGSHESVRIRKAQTCSLPRRALGIANIDAGPVLGRRRASAGEYAQQRPA